MGIMWITTGVRSDAKRGEKKMRQLVLDVSSGMVLAGFVTMVTIWMMVLGG